MRSSSSGCYSVPSVLMTNSLGLLPMWNDELFTVRAARLPVDALLEMVRGDVHPPLYFLLAHYWIQIAPGQRNLTQLRLLSVVFALLATIALDRLWLKHVPGRLRAWCLSLWTLSACLLLYSRMARSYSLQVLGFIVVCWAVWRWSQEIRFLETDADLGRLAGGAALYALRARNRRMGGRESAADDASA